MNRFLSLLLLLISVAFASSAAYVVRGVEGTVKVIRQGTTIIPKPQAQLEPNDFVKIEKDARLDVLDTSTNKIYSLDTPKIDKLSRLIDRAKKGANNSLETLQSNVRISRNKRDNGVVYAEKGKIKRSQEVFDPEGAHLEMDNDKLGEKLYEKLLEISDDSDGKSREKYPEYFVITQNSPKDGISFSVENTLDHPIYFNLFKINQSTGSITISELGQPIGCYALLPSQGISREQSKGVDPNELHILIMTGFQFDIDNLINKLNALIDAKVQISNSENINFFILPVL